MSQQATEQRVTPPPHENPPPEAVGLEQPACRRIGVDELEVLVDHDRIGRVVENAEDLARLILQPAVASQTPEAAAIASSHPLRWPAPEATRAHSSKDAGITGLKRQTDHCRSAWMWGEGGGW